MSEQSVKKRGWVKNAAIIFLTILLLLTFFSQTIMNRSLPEVAVEYAQGGSITAKIRGSGTVSANENYEVLISQTREVSAVMVRAGDTVAAGDILFTLADKESDELQTARDELDDLRLAYQKAIINTSGSDYAQEQYEIQQAQTELNEAINKRNENTVSDSTLAAAKAEMEQLKERVNDYTRELASMDSGDVTQSQITAAERAIEEMEYKISDAENKLWNDKRSFSEEWTNLENATSGFSGSKRRGEMARIASEWDEMENGTRYVNAYTTITGLEDDIADMEIDLGYLEEDLKELKSAYKDVSAYNRVEENLQKAEHDLETATEEYEDMDAKRKDWNTANEAVKSAQSKLDNLLFALAEQQKADGKDQAIDQLDLSKMKNDIAKAEKRVSELTQESVDATVVAAVSGTVTEISVTAGHTTVPDEALAVIEVPDMGYGLSFAVTNEQAKKVKVGDPAEVSNYYWGPQIKATLTAIRNDPEKPGQGKILSFTLTGEVESGSTLTLAVGQKSANYDTVVPNSALRSDSNGDFVLIIEAKSTPLGNRYIARRADVEVLATDDTHSAVMSGALTGWDYVITTATAPIEPGMQVRLVE